ncbi:MAG: hypothetical protein WA988_09620 [Candidatus Nanopelagicales bacterium]
MSYICVTAIRIDKENRTYLVKGGSNNLTPRWNEWDTQWFPLSGLLANLDGGNLQFTTRTDKHAKIDALVRKYSAEVQDVIGESPWSCEHSGEHAAQYAEINARFVDELCGPLADGKFILRHAGGYVLRLHRGGCTVTRQRDRAKVFGKSLADEVAARFGTFTIEAIAQEHA